MLVLSCSSSVGFSKENKYCDDLKFLDTWVWADSADPVQTAPEIPKKNPKNSDTRKYPEIGTVSFYDRVMGPKDADGMANSVDPDQEQSDLGLHCLPRPFCLKT